MLKADMYPRKPPKIAPWLVVAALALGIRVAYCMWVNSGPYPFAKQYREYIMAAQRLLEYGAFLSPITPDAARAEVSALLPPLYTLWVAGVYAVLGVGSFGSTLIVQLANALAAAVACGIAFQIGVKLLGARAGWIAGLVATLNPAFIGFTNYVWDTCFFALAVTLSAWWSLQLRQREPRAFGMLAFGVWLGIVALLNPALTLAYPILVIMAVRADQRLFDRRVVRGVALSILGWGLALTPWSIRNYVQLGTVPYVRSGFWLEVWLGVAPEADQAGADVYRKNFPLVNPEVGEEIAQIGELRFVQDRGEKARLAIEENPGRFVKLVAWRTVDYWLGSAFSHSGPHGWFLPATRQRQLVMLVFTAELLLVLFGLARGRLRTPPARYLLAMLLVFSATYCITHVQVRFRVPVEPLVAVLIGLGLSARPGRRPIDAAAEEFKND